MFDHPKLGPLYFVQASSPSGGHHFYIEGVFQQENGQWSLIDETSYYYDVAGIEGLDLFPAFILLNILFLALVLIIASWMGFVYHCMRLQPHAQKFARSFWAKMSRRSSLLAIGASTVCFLLWFVPYDGGHCGETGVRRLRFAVYEWEGFGETDQIDYMRLLFSLDQVGVSWGGTGAWRKIGGVLEYFGVREATCSFDGKPPSYRKRD